MKKTKQSRRDFVTIGGLLLVGVLVGACRKTEQGRILRYEKGQYQGKADEELTDEELAALRQRVSLQQQ